VIVLHLLVALGGVGLVLGQQGKGADAGASFGAGASASVLGSQGSSTFLSRYTAILAAVFFTTSMALAFYAMDKAEALRSVGLPDPAALEVQPAKPAADDVPVLEEQRPATQSGDVPQAPEQK